MLAVFLEHGQVLTRDVPVPERPAGFALLQLICAGICNTDLELQRGYYQFHGIPGHEFVALVADADDRGLVGKRVAGEINLACGLCDLCRSGMGRHCRNRSVLGILGHPGAFAEFFTLPETNLHVLPDLIKDTEAVFIEPLAAACEILDQLEIAPQSGIEVAVLGDGKLGLLIAQVLLAHGLKVTVYGRHLAKLQIASRAGAGIGEPSNMPVATYSTVVECSGSADGLSAAVRMTRPRGTVVMKSTIHNKVPVDMAQVIVNEISLVGSRCGRFEPAIQLLESRKVDVKSLLAAEYPLAQAALAFEKASTRGLLKVLLCN